LAGIAELVGPLDARRLLVSALDLTEHGPLLTPIARLVPEVLFAVLETYRPRR
jgi:hypothetical protein